MAAKKKSTAKRKKVVIERTQLTPSLAEEIRGIFVHGTENAEGNRVYVTLESIAEDYNVAPRTLYKRSSDEGWVEQRAVFTAKLQSEIDDKKRKDLVAQAIDFDGRSLQLARGIQSQVTRILNNAVTRAKDAEAAGNLILDPLSPTQLTMLSNALSASQKVGRLALGEHTDKLNVTDSTQADAELADAVAGLFGLEEHRKEGSRKPH